MSAVQALIGIGLFAGLMLSGASVSLRDSVGGSVFAYTFVVAGLYEAVTCPLAWYRTYRVERAYELSTATFSSWLRDYLRSVLLTLLVALAAAACVYATMRFSPRLWWVVSAIAGTAFAAVMTALAPIWILPLFHRIRPLDRAALSRRLHRLSARAGVPVLGVYEWNIGETTTRANAALVGAGPTRRILVSDTLLAGYTDDEIEVVLAHEMGHHVHHDMVKGLAAEFVLLLVSFWAGAAALGASATVTGRPLADVAGMPILVLAVGGVWMLVSPLLKTLSRSNERRADRFALELTQRPAAFIAAVRRMAAQNLAEEYPSRTAFLMFHTHPTVEERIAAARGFVVGVSGRRVSPSCRGSARPA